MATYQLTLVHYHWQIMNGIWVMANEHRLMGAGEWVMANDYWHMGKDKCVASTNDSVASAS